jgi:uncharacterized protein (DUF58 family)
MKKAWQRLRDALEGNMRQQITRLGFFFSVTVALVGLAAFVSGNNLLFLLLAALLATMLISGFVSRLGLAGLELHLSVPDHIAARRAVPGRLRIRNRKWMSPSFSLHLSGSPESGLRDTLYIPVIPGRGVLDEHVDLWFDRRGIHKDNTFFFESRFPFGFAHRRAQVRLEREVLVYPCVDSQEGFEATLDGIAGEVEARQQGRGTDFYRIRPYEYLESARHVDWKATAHIGELQVREFTREQDRAVTLFLDLDVPADAWDSWFERAVDCTAFLVWRLNDRGTRLRFLTQRYDRRVPEEASVYDVLRYLALVEPVPGARLPLPDDQNVPVAISFRDTKTADAGWLGTHVPGTPSVSQRAGRSPA